MSFETFCLFNLWGHERTNLTIHILGRARHEIAFGASAALLGKATHANSSSTIADPCSSVQATGHLWKRKHLHAMFHLFSPHNYLSFLPIGFLSYPFLNSKKGTCFPIAVAQANRCQEEVPTFKGTCEQAAGVWGMDDVAGVQGAHIDKSRMYPKDIIFKT